MPLDCVTIPPETAEAGLCDALARHAGRIALVSSFGAESAVLLHMVAGIDRATPVIFLDTGKLFAETLAYRDSLVAQLGLLDIRNAQPDADRIAALDPAGTLWRDDSDLCCWQRKVEPLDAALHGFDAWITGRKRHQASTRHALPVIEASEDGRIKINPLAGWNAARITAYFATHDLPRHPLHAQGFASIGCIPCTRAVVAGEDERAGRWSGTGKIECGIHLSRSKAHGQTIGQ